MMRNNVDIIEFKALLFLHNFLLISGLCHMLL